MKVPFSSTKFWRRVMPIMLVCVLGFMLFSCKKHNATPVVTGAKWTQLTINYNYSINNLAFTGKDTGYAVGDPNGYYTPYLFTYDNGNSWKISDVNVNNFNVSAILSCASAVNGYGTPLFLTGLYIVQGKEQYQLYKSTDHASTWQLVDTLGNAVKKVYFFDPLNGISVDGSYVFQTADGGVHFNLIYTGNIVSIQFFDKNNIYIIGPTYIAKTVNGGTTWTSQAFINGFSVNSLTKICFVDTNTGYACFQAATSNNDSYNITIYKTADGGNTWAAVSTSALSGQAGIVGFHFLNATVGYVAFGTGIYSTADGGQTWQSELQTEAGITNLYFAPDGTGFAYGFGFILKKTQ